MATNTPPKPPPAPVERAKNFLLYGFLISIALHLIAGPFVKFENTHVQEDQPQKVTVMKVPTPPPTPPPTPTPKPTVPPTPPPKMTPPPKQTPAPQQPKIKINTQKTEAKSNTGPSETANKYTQGNTQGIPQGQGTAAPSTAPPATPAPVTPSPVPTPKPLACAHPNVQPGTDFANPPDMPAIAQQQGITGDVTVDVALDENSKVTSVVVESSPSKVLNANALAAARTSKFHTEIKDCKPVAATYRFIVTFDAQ
jgi:periplasmic protein TonB